MPWPWDDARTPPGPDLLLVRHGRTRYNAERRFLGRTDIGLDEVGHAEARTLADALPGSLVRIYASPLARASETARYLGAEVEAVPDLAELSQGALEGLRVREGVDRFPDFFAAWAVDPTDAAVPGGESLGTCRDRALAALDEIAARHRPGEAVAVVTHQMVIASVACALRGEPLVRWREHGVRNGSLTVVRRTARGWRVLLEDWLPHDARGPERPDV